MIIAPAITPMPPVASAVLPWDGAVVDTVQLIGEARSKCGDTFVIDSGDERYLFLFSPAGLRRFYELPEHEASKGIADVKMLLRKLPEELFHGRRTLPHELFGARLVSERLDILDTAISRQIERLQPGGEIELFEFSRRLGHVLSLTSWVGTAVLDSRRLDELMDALDQLDGSEAFVAPERMREVAHGEKAVERAALGNAERILIELIRKRRPHTGGFSDEIVSRWKDAPDSESWTGIARDIILLHMASMSNLFAAIGWTLVHLCQNPGILSRVRAPESTNRDLVARCAMESIRLAQRSIMLRTILAPVEINDGTSVYRVAPGATIATFLPLTNLAPGFGLDAYQPDRWRGRHPTLPSGTPAEAITTFGHGVHACPARPFSLAVICRVVERVFSAFDLLPFFDEAHPPTEQIGGVARSASPCRVLIRER